MALRANESRPGRRRRRPVVTRREQRRAGRGPDAEAHAAAKDAAAARKGRSRATEATRTGPRADEKSARAAKPIGPRTVRYGRHPTRGGSTRMSVKATVASNDPVAARRRTRTSGEAIGRVDALQKQKERPKYSAAPFFLCRAFHARPRSRSVLRLPFDITETVDSIPTRKGATGAN